MLWLHQQDPEYVPGKVYPIHKNADGTWPKRPTSDPKVIFMWRGTTPFPPVVINGEGGAIDGVDMLMETDS